MRLSNRIYKLAESVRRGDSVADIGTDHGYVPMLLMKKGISPAVIMSDISEGSLSKAVETFKAAGIDMPDTAFRVGDGLDTILPGEVDDVIIAGLGGLTITEILTNDIAKSLSYSRLILQPRKHSGNLRFFLYTHGWDITGEHLAKEGKFVCEIITAVPAAFTQNGLPADTLSAVREAPYPEDDIRWKYPAAIVESNRDLAAIRIDWKIGSIEEQIGNLSNSSSDHSELISRLIRERDYLRELID